MSEPRGHLPTPTSSQLLRSVLELGREIHLDMREDAVLDRFLRALVELFPGRALAIRAIDLRGQEPARFRVAGGALRADIDPHRVTVKRSALAKTRVKQAVLESARLRVSSRWDCPFRGIAAGFCVPLVASGELYGVLDVGYPLGTDASDEDEQRVLPIANHLSVVLRNERLHRETMVLRDYQATLIEHANALILGVDRHWRVTVCNHALCRITRAARGDLLGSDIRDWLPPRDRARLTQMIRDALAGQKTDAVEVELRTKTGPPVRTMWSIAAISRKGRVEAVVAVGQDLTRIRELQSQVIQAEKLAQLGQLAAGVVHELNNPLTSITVYADFLLKKAERSTAGSPAMFEESDREKLARISAGAQRILTFARDLVQYAKPAGAQVQPMSINAVVEQALSFCEHLFGRAGVTLVTDLAPAVPDIDAVSGQVQQVVINLVTNAVHAVETGGTVWVTTRVPDLLHVAVIVEDDGGGVAPQDRERIFEPFFTTKYDGAGTGLGLSIVSNIVESHGGTISVGVSRAGGARFTVVFPLRRG